jgi:hypothetical protein
MWYSTEPVLAAIGLSTLALTSAFSSFFLASPAMHAPGGGPPPVRITLCDAPTFSLPPTIDLEEGLEPVVRWTLEHSPTFRQQCRVLTAATNVTATVRYALRPPGTASRARAVFRERSSGVLTADIELGVSTDLTELLGHEFEHLIEQLDGVDLPGLARRGQAVRMPDGAFETTRAIQAGHRVMGEVVDNAPDRVRRASGSIWRAVRRALTPGVK